MQDVKRKIIYFWLTHVFLRYIGKHYPEFFKKWVYDSTDNLIERRIMLARYIGDEQMKFEAIAIKYKMQQGFDNQNNMANQREILAAVNQNFHDNLNVIQDKYGELTRDIYGVSGQVAQVLANQNQCLTTVGTLAA